MPTNEEQIPYYNSSLLERYLNYIVGSSDVIPSEVDSRLAEYLRYLCLNGTIKEQQIVSQLLPLKADLVDGKVPSTQLPSYVSEIVEVETYADLPEEGDANVIYVVRSPSTATYRWTGTQYIALDEQGQYFSVKVSSTNITTMAELRTYITNINNYGMHCFFDFSDFITNGYICTVLLFETNDVNYCVIFDVINGKTYVDYNGYVDTDTVQAYVGRTGDNIPRVIGITDNTTTMQDIATMLSNVNVVGHHILFDLHTLKTNCYLCTISAGAGEYTIFDTVAARLSTGTYDSTTTLVSALNGLKAIGTSDTIIDKTTAELHAMETAGTLVPGQKYAITDYAPTWDAGTAVMQGHQFDIIVKAVSTTVLDKDITFRKHTGDTYFALCDLSKWKGKLYGYVSDKGYVIDELTDEYNNTCNYDFKNVKWDRFYIRYYSQAGSFNDPMERQVSSSYTFTNDGSDITVSNPGATYNNKIGLQRSSNPASLSAEGIVLSSADRMHDITIKNSFKLNFYISENTSKMEFLTLQTCSDVYFYLSASYKSDSYSTYILVNTSYLGCYGNCYIKNSSELYIISSSYIYLDNARYVGFSSFRNLKVFDAKYLYLTFSGTTIWDSPLMIMPGFNMSNSSLSSSSRQTINVSTLGAVRVIFPNHTYAKSVVALDEHNQPTTYKMFPRYWTGTQDEYDALSTYYDDVIYNIVEPDETAGE